MSILVYGMEMPTSCARCRCVRGCKAVNDRIKRLDKEPWLPGDHRHSDCPLIPVQPHGRLIDASEKIRVQIYDDMTEDFHMVDMTIDDLLSQGWIDANAPTIIPAEEGE